MPKKKMVPWDMVLQLLLCHSDVVEGRFIMCSFPHPGVQRVDKAEGALAFLLLNTANPSSMRRVFALLPVPEMQQ